jgi:hypothetical protein
MYGKSSRERPIGTTETIERENMCSAVSFPYAFPDIHFSAEPIEIDVRM